MNNQQIERALYRALDAGVARARINQMRVICNGMIAEDADEIDNALHLIEEAIEDASGQQPL